MYGNIQQTRNNTDEEFIGKKNQ